MGLLKEIWFLLGEMSPFLLLGFAIAGVLYVLFPSEKIYSHLSRGKFSSVVKSALFGVPLPLCSCGVIPVAAHLRKSGANRGATLAFLISTPTTGVDSILATYGLLGLVFAVFRPIAAFITGTIAGTLVNFTYTDKNREKPPPQNHCHICDNPEPHTHTVGEKVARMIQYSFGELVEDVGKWLTIGIVAGGLISFLVPDRLVMTYLGNPLLAYPVMILISVPMYVCATGSIPIAASLILKGMTPGAGLVFLIGGPATNTATMSFVAGKLGKKTLIIYLIVTVVSAVIFGILLDLVWQSSGTDFIRTTGKTDMLPNWLKTVSSVLLVGLIIRAFLAKHSHPHHHTTEEHDMEKVFYVPDMSCKHCTSTITSALKAVDGTAEIKIDLSKKIVEVEGDIPEEKIAEIIEKAGYTPQEYSP